MDPRFSAVPHASIPPVRVFGSLPSGRVTWTLPLVSMTSFCCCRCPPAPLCCVPPGRLLCVREHPGRGSAFPLLYRHAAGTFPVEVAPRISGRDPTFRSANLTGERLGPVGSGSPRPRRSFRQRGGAVRFLETAAANRRCRPAAAGLPDVGFQPGASRRSPPQPRLGIRRCRR